ncbi:MAG: hypothetical protein R2706_00380 [Acidimicrobiales bacterium]
MTVARMTLPGLSGPTRDRRPNEASQGTVGGRSGAVGLILDADWSPTDGLPSDMHGVVTTYQQVGTSPEAFVPIAAGGFVILDEIHHAGEDRSWGDGVLTAFNGATRQAFAVGHAVPKRYAHHPVCRVRQR